ncbi:MAG: cupin-like domain-containing protein [Deltaproteobacteria bacterium]|nr:cupin-like domain-containing protein [Deltaproteobacteria bacterium]
MSPAWASWAADNLLRGVSRDEVERALRARGASAEEASQGLGELERSTVYAPARALARRGRQLELVAKLLSELQRTATRPREVPRREGTTAEEFFDTWYATGNPVILTDVVPRWPAFGRWSPGYLRERFGAVEVQAVVGREGDPDYDQNTPKHSVAMTLGAFIDRVERAGVSNDLYLVANNHNLEREPLKALYADVSLDPGLFDAARFDGCAALWLGPEGTVTPLHHDTANILFCQVYGAKRVRLVAPWEAPLLGCTRGVYSGADPEREDPLLARCVVRDVHLAAGEALFIPAGWWHHVRALSVSISVGFTNFVRDNRFNWFRPGEIR